MFSDRTNWDLTTNRLSEVLAEKRKKKTKLWDLTVSNPTECGFGYDRRTILKALARPGALRYQPNPKGLLGARQAIAKYHSAFGTEIDPDDIFLTTGTSEAYAFALRLLCNPGDEVLVPEPSYPLLNYLADIQDVKLIRYPLLYDHGWQIDFHHLEKAISTRGRAVVVVNPNNPTGHFVGEADAKKLNEVCSAGNMAIISDEVFFDFRLTGKRLSSFAGNTGALTFTLNGLSKMCGLPQMKSSWLVLSGPDDLKGQARDRMEVIADTFLSMNTPVQLAVRAFLSQRTGFQKQVMKRLRANLRMLDRQLASKSTCERLEVEGGWNVVLRVPAIHSDEEVAIQLIDETDVLLHPGHFYDFPGDGFLVASLITPERIFAEGMKRVLAAF